MPGTDGECLATSLLEESNVGADSIPRDQSGSVAGPPVDLPMPSRAPITTVMHEPEGGVALHALPRTTSSASVPGSVAGSTGAASVAGSTRRRVIKPVSMYNAALLLLCCDNLPPARSMRAHMYRRRAFNHLRLRRA